MASIPKTRPNPDSGRRGAFLALAPFLALTLGAALSSCAGGGGGGGGSGSGLFILSCSLGCSSSNGQSGQFSCGLTDVYVNQEIRVTFNRDIDLNSVTNNSFQVIERDSGKTPPGVFLVDSVDPRVLVYRPQLTFDSTGNPIFGLTADKEYTLFLPGTSQGDLGPFIRSMNGEALKTRLACTLEASRGVFDLSPGRPLVAARVQRVLTYDAMGRPETFRTVQANGAINVFRFTDVVLEFNDAMNPATLANPVTMVSSTIEVFVDPDGDASDSSDQLPVAGTFQITVDQAARRTVVVFHADAGFPSAGDHSTDRRRIVVNLSPSIADLGGNLLANPSAIVFTPEVIPFPELAVTEEFDVNTFEDDRRSGSPWGNGLLGTGPGGGSGYLGDFVLPAGQVLTLRTDVETFSDPLFENPEVFQFSNVLGQDPMVPLEVVGGIFEFSSMTVEAGAILRFVGPNPVRIFSRGEILVQGRIDLSGIGATIHNHASFDGGTGGEAGAGGGSGGDGGQRPDGELWGPELDNPSDPGPIDVLNPADYFLVNGQSGGGIPFPDALAPTSHVSSGVGGLAWPQPGALPPPHDQIHFPADPSDSLTSFPYSRELNCTITAPGGSGSGGGYARSGTSGRSFFIGLPTQIPPIAPPRPGGDSAQLGLGPLQRSLDPDLGFLRGGSGGGGGGANLLLTRVNGISFFDCTFNSTVPLEVVEYFSGSGAAGGGAGGAGQLQGGRSLVLNGAVLASGGDGGGATGLPQLASPGGGASGGAVLLQAPAVSIQPTPNRLDVTGGIGGEGFDTGSPANGRAFGGDGGPGLIRIETFAPAPSVTSEGFKVTPDEAALKAKYGASATIADVLSTGIWDARGEGAAGFSGAQSCWFSERDLVDPNDPTTPISNFFQLLFSEDGAELGWDLEVLLDGFASPQSYRGENDVTGPGGMTLEELWGSDLGSSPLVVRFQGAKVVGTIDQPCEVPLAGFTSPIVIDSLTGWVSHPSELQVFHSDSGLTPNVFRFVVIWDSNDPDFPAIEGIENLTIRLQPD